MKISIITVCRNSAATIEDTIKSVLSQTYPEVEYLIIDGGSTDGTLEVIDKYRSQISKVVSERDNGIYDGMNKGLRLASGEVVGMINADDYYNYPEALQDVVNCLQQNQSEACYGDLIYVDRHQKNKIVRRWRPGFYQPAKLKNGWIMPHPSLFIRKSVYERWGLFDASFRIAGDYELMLRFLKNGLTVSYLPKFLVCMREGGVSGTNLHHRRLGWQELKKAWLMNYRSLPPFFILRRVLFKMHQLLER
ncbi:MAG: glycosyltransferase family 2 protein [Candidatus Komeilibacteria bacterium]|nr:glycosyltransferase family 2 protein [Candidatus Komeilibacteria bacterium]